MGLFGELVKNAESDLYPFHMPGHKRRMTGFDPYSIDITEIDGFDDMHRPSGLIAELNKELTDYFGGEETRILVNGSTCGVLSAISACAGLKDKVLIGSNCHKSAKDAIRIRGIEPVFIDPEEIEGPGLKGGINPESVINALQKDRNIKAVFITSPTYDGFLSDVGTIAKLCHNVGIPLIVDSAHGAHAGLYKGFTGEFHFENASLSGADIVIKSLHKNLPAFTQTAILTVSGTLVDRDKLGFFYSAYQSTSPSYILMAGADGMLSVLKEEGQTRFRVLDERLKEIRKAAESNEKISLVGPEYIGYCGVYGFDPTKLLICHKRYDGEELYGKIRTLFRLQPEKISGRAVLLMTSIMDDEEGFKRLADALKEMP